MKIYNKTNLILAGIISLGLAFQLIILFWVLDPNDLFWPDPKLYYGIAKGLYAGGPYSTVGNDSNIVVAPGYPYILSFMMHIVGTSVVALKLCHVALFPLFLYSLYKLGEAWQGERTGLVFTFLGIFYPYYLYIPLTLYTESFSIYLFPFIAYLIFKLRNNYHWSHMLLLSVLIALSIMIRPTNVYWIVIGLFYMLYKKHYSISELIKRSLVMILIPIICVLAWLERNKNLYGDYIFTKTQTVILDTYNENRRIGSKEWAPLPEGIQKRLSGAKNFKEINHISQEEVKSFIFSRPFRALAIAFMNCVNYWNPIPKTFTKDGMASNKFKILAAIPYVVFLFLGTIGFIRKRRDLFAQTLLLLMLLNTLFNAPLMVSVRYRVIVDFSFILLASITVEVLLSRFLISLYRKKIESQHYMTFHTLLPSEDGNREM
jgi:hypothetical protein